MPNKTIYVRDSDLPLWEAAQAKLGESISSVFAQFLRERMERVDGFLHVLHSQPASQGTPSFAVMFAPVGPTGSGGPMKPKYLKGRTQLLEFLEQIGVLKRDAAQVESDLRKHESVSIRLDLPRASVTRWF